MFQTLLVWMHYWLIGGEILVQLAPFFFVSWNDGGGNVSRYIAWACDFLGYQNWEDPYRKVPSSLVAKFLRSRCKDDGDYQNSAYWRTITADILEVPTTYKISKNAKVVEDWLPRGHDIDFISLWIRWGCENNSMVIVSFVHNELKFEA